jgi:4-amino-4-deoxy-L-arabinose transferase-like glycosyltransferase
MLATGDWLLPRVNGELYLAKPPLLYWLSTAIAHLAGAANEWAVRLPSAIAATAVALFAYRFARRQFGPWPALFTLQLLIANSSFAMHARRAEIEMLLTAFCFCALLAALQFTRGDGSRRWLWLSYLLLGAAVLTKGPVALLFVTLPLLVDALYLRQSRQWQALRDPVGGCCSSWSPRPGSLR